MFDEVHLLPMSMKSVRRKVEDFLADNGLRLAPVDCYAAIEDEEGRLVAGGGLDGDVIKCVAVSGKERSGGLMGKLISYLINLASSRGAGSVKVYTKPSNRQIFESLGFELLAEAPEAMLMESGRGSLGRYERYLEGLRKEGRNGAIVMNANPFTMGHRYLVRKAAAMVDNLYVIVVKEDRSRFSYAERKSMVEAGCWGLENVTVCDGSDYVISAATFPTYFLKRLDDATDTYITLDLDLFVRHVAPALGVTVRFAGSEVADALTARYNALMQELLPKAGIGFEVVERLTKRRLFALGPDEPVSASSVREAIDEEVFSVAMSLCPRSTRPYLLADCAVSALWKELDATPKPGLVDREHKGAHEDMDYDKMSLSIRTLRPYFVALALCGWEKEADSEEVRRIGIEAEKAMLEATGGVNTHKGALYCLGLSVAAAAYCLSRGINVDDVRFRAQTIARGMPATSGTHGAAVLEKYHVAGASEQAREGWPGLFFSWLPYYRILFLSGDEDRMQKTLLRIMSELDDTNVLYRKGSEGAKAVKDAAASLLADYSPEGLGEMDRKFVEEGISPGGSADMLSLTVFYNTIIY